MKYFFVFEIQIPNGQTFDSRNAPKSHAFFFILYILLIEIMPVHIDDIEIIR